MQPASQSGPTGTSAVPLRDGNRCPNVASGGSWGRFNRPVCVEVMMLLSGCRTSRGFVAGLTFMMPCVSHLRKSPQAVLPESSIASVVELVVSGPSSGDTSCSTSSLFNIKLGCCLSHSLALLALFPLPLPFLLPFLREGLVSSLPCQMRVFPFILISQVASSL